MNTAAGINFGQKLLTNFMMKYGFMTATRPRAKRIGFSNSTTEATQHKQFSMSISALSRSKSLLSFWRIKYERTSKEKANIGRVES